MLDDTQIAGRDIAHNDSVLEKLPHRAKSYSLKLNVEKFKVRKQQVQHHRSHHLGTGTQTRPVKSESNERNATSFNKRRCASVCRIYSVSSQISPDAGKS